MFAATAAKSLQSCPTLCDPKDGSPPGSPVPGILQARALEWVAISFSQCMKVKSESELAHSCPTLSYRMDCSLPVSSVHGIFQARVLEWVAIAFSQWTWVWVNSRSWRWKRRPGCCSPLSHEESDTTEDWTELNWIINGCWILSKAFSAYVEIIIWIYLSIY